MVVTPAVTTVVGGIVLQVNWNALKTDDINPTQDQDSYQYKPLFTSGDGENEYDNLYRARITVSSATPDTLLDLQSLVNPFGDTWAATNIKVAYVRNLSTTTGDKVQIGAAASNPWVAPFDGDTGAADTIGPNGSWLRSEPIDGFAVSAGSKVVKFTWDGVSPEIDLDIFFFGSA